MSNEVRKKNIEVTRALAQAVLLNADLQLLLTLDDTVPDAGEEAFMKLQETEETLNDLRRRYDALVCAGFPGQAMLFVKAESGERSATVEDLRLLCRANGLTVLSNGSYFCANCGGVRTTEECRWCELEARSKHVGEPG